MDSPVKQCFICTKRLDKSSGSYLAYHIPTKPSFHHQCMVLMHNMYKARFVGELYREAGFFARLSLKKKYKQAHKSFITAYLHYCILQDVDAHEFVLSELSDEERETFEQRLRTLRSVLRSKET